MPIINYDVAAITAGTTPSTTVTLLDTPLNSLASGANSAANSTAYDNTPSGSTGGYLNGTASLYVALAATSTGSIACYLYELASLDGGTTYPAIDPLTNPLIATFGINPGITSVQTVVRRVNLLPMPCKYYLSNGTGVALASTGNTLKLRGDRIGSN
jgi:hypothetical protein